MKRKDAQVLDEVSVWLLRMHDSDVSAADIAELKQWRDAHPDHETAWQRAENFLQSLQAVPPAIGRSTLQRPVSSGRRRAIQHLAVLFAVAPLAWAATRTKPWRHLMADYQTSIGELRKVILPDGTQLVLNTSSAVSLEFNDARRLIQLDEGEILVTTAKDLRPMLVKTLHGTAQPVGTRFSVRQFEDHSEVAVFEGAVDLQPSGSNSIIRINTGERATFSTRTTQPLQRVSSTASLWTHGMLVAENMRLGDLVAELDRYQAGRLRCDPQVAELRISGAFPFSDISQSLRLIEDILPVQAHHRLHYWTVIEARP